MTADKELWGGRWLVERAAGKGNAPRPPAKVRRRKHASWVLEFGLMFLLVALLPRKRKRK